MEKKEKIRYSCVIIEILKDLFKFIAIVLFLTIVAYLIAKLGDTISNYIGRNQSPMGAVNFFNGILYLFIILVFSFITFKMIKKIFRSIKKYIHKVIDKCEIKE